MNKGVSSIFKNISYAVMSNLTSLVVSSLVILIVPKLIGVEEYGLWQFYLFCAGYVGFLHFGWIDGIYLRYGGEDYRNLNKPQFYSQFLMLSVMQIIIAAIILIATEFIDTSSANIFIFRMVAITMIIENIKTFFLYTLQMTNRINAYARITIIDRLVYIILTLALLLGGSRNYQVLIMADIFGKFIGLLLSLYLCKEIAFNRLSKFKIDFKEMTENINVGIKLLFSNIASLLIIGVVRFGIMTTWGVTVFGKVSLTFSISNLMMTFINALGIILFPMLRRTKTENLSKIYSVMRDILMLVLLAAMVIYFPLKSLMGIWLPQYKDTLKFMALLFPMLVFEGKMSLLLNTYLKALRKEKWMLKINVFVSILSCILTALTTYVFKNLDMAVLTITFLLALRAILAELYLSKLLEIHVKKDIYLEVIFAFIFICSSWFLPITYGMIIYLSMYLLYLVIKRNDIKHIKSNLQQLFSN